MGTRLSTASTAWRHTRVATLCLAPWTTCPSPPRCTASPTCSFPPRQTLDARPSKARQSAARHTHAPFHPSNPSLLYHLPRRDCDGGDDDDDGKMMMMMRGVINILVFYNKDALVTIFWYGYEVSMD